MNGISTKVAAGTTGGAAATLLWLLLATFVPPVRHMDAASLATATGTTATLLTAWLGFWTNETAIVTPPPVQNVYAPPALTGTPPPPYLDPTSQPPPSQGATA